LEEKNYNNFDLPEYFQFDDLLKKSSLILRDKSICDLCRNNSSGKKDWPSNYEDVNYTFLSNKDGSFAWRPLQLIHPLLFVDLVNFITEHDNWYAITKRFAEFNKGYLECISIPRISTDGSSHRSKQITNWWENIEQRSLKLSLQYNYVYLTDITNCYGSIYTHSIEWALTEGGKEAVKRRLRGSEKTLGSEIDMKIRNMTYGQTNGIPQGSSLMDFISEIVLGYADIELTKLLDEKKIPKNDFCILRYRDDYRIFVNNPNIGHEIMKCLNTVLFELGMKMNAEKTSEQNDIIMASLKKEKLERLYYAPVGQSWQKEALRIYQLSKKYPNSGLVLKELNLYFDKLDKVDQYLKDDIELLIAVLINISIRSPRTFNWVSAIVSKLLPHILNVKKREEIVRQIHDKYKKIPNTSYIDVWLQRISAPSNIDIEYKDKLTKIAILEIKNNELWNCLWLDKQIVSEFNSVKISNLKDKIEKKEITPVVTRKEVELFKNIINS
jgi:RNA-directed DNA polymerase